MCDVRHNNNMTRVIHTATDAKIVCEMFVKCLIGKGPSETSYANWSKDAKHRVQAKLAGIFEPIWPENNSPLPWRLTKEEKDVLEQRMSNCVWPHYMEPMYYKGIPPAYLRSRISWGYYSPMYFLNSLFIFTCDHIIT